MKRTVLILSVSLAIISIIFFADYVIASIIGVLAKLFHAGSFFYDNIFPYIVGVIITVSIVYPISKLFINKNKKVTAKILKHEYKQHKFSA